MQTVRVERVPQDPRCRDLCSGERAATEGPAEYGHEVDGRRVIRCKCCGQLLRLASLKDYGPDVTMARFGGGATANRVRLYSCVACSYDIQSIAEIT